MSCITVHFIRESTGGLFSKKGETSRHLRLRDKRR